MKIYTKTGDDGTTGLFGGKRTDKANSRIQAIGEIDELNAEIGILYEMEKKPEIKSLLKDIQQALFILGSELASNKGTDVGNPSKKTKIHVSHPENRLIQIETTHVHALEKNIDTYSLKLAPLKNFILPNGTLLAAYYHHARAVCRRAERRLVGLHREEKAADFHNRKILAYINRLSDLLFILARYDVAQNNKEETIWKP